MSCIDFCCCCCCHCWCHGNFCCLCFRLLLLFTKFFLCLCRFGALWTRDEAQRLNSPGLNSGSGLVCLFVCLVPGRFGVWLPGRNLPSLPAALHTICVIELIDIFKLCAAVGINLNFRLLMLLIQSGSRHRRNGHCPGHRVKMPIERRALMLVMMTLMMIPLMLIGIGQPRSRCGWAALPFSWLHFPRCRF